MDEQEEGCHPIGSSALKFFNTMSPALEERDDGNTNKAFQSSHKSAQLTPNPCGHSWTGGTQKGHLTGSLEN